MEWFNRSLQIFQRAHMWWWIIHGTLVIVNVSSVTLTRHQTQTANWTFFLWDIWWIKCDFEVERKGENNIYIYIWKITVLLINFQTPVLCCRSRWHMKTIQCCQQTRWILPEGLSFPPYSATADFNGSKIIYFVKVCRRSLQLSTFLLNFAWRIAFN